MLLLSNVNSTLIIIESYSLLILSNLVRRLHTDEYDVQDGNNNSNSAITLHVIMRN